MVGIELAEAFAKRGKKVVLWEKEYSLLPGKVCQDVADMVRGILEGYGVDVRCGAEYPGGDNFVVYGGGVKPSLSFLPLGVERHSGGVVVDTMMRTSYYSAFAAGGCVSTKDLLTGVRGIFPLAPVAYHTGRVAGGNAVGMGERLKGICASWVIALGDWAISVGGRIQGNVVEVKTDKVWLKGFFDGDALVGLEIVVPRSYSSISALVPFVVGVKVDALKGKWFPYHPLVSEVPDVMSLLVKLFERRYYGV